jgi:hypothetical protein
MAVVHVRVMRMFVHQWVVAMRVGVGLATVPWEVVPVPVMHVVTMRVRMLDRLVGVPVHVALAYVQPYAERHQSARRACARCEGISE